MTQTDFWKKRPFADVRISGAISGKLIQKDHLLAVIQNIQRILGHDTPISWKLTQANFRCKIFAWTSFPKIGLGHGRRIKISKKWISLAEIGRTTRKTEIQEKVLDEFSRTRQLGCILR